MKIAQKYILSIFIYVFYNNAVCYSNSSLLFSLQNTVKGAIVLFIQSKLRKCDSDEGGRCQGTSGSLLGVKLRLTGGKFFLLTFALFIRTCASLTDALAAVKCNSLKVQRNHNIIFHMEVKKKKEEHLQRL